MVVRKYVVEGSDAKKVYEVLQVSYVGKNKKMPPSKGECGLGYEIEYRYDDEVLYIEERTTKCPGYVTELLCFLIHYDGFYYMEEWSEDGVPLSYEVRDDEGKYFVRPPKTEYELQEELREEARKIERAKKNEDMPF